MYSIYIQCPLPPSAQCHPPMAAHRAGYIILIYIHPKYIFSTPKMPAKCPQQQAAIPSINYSDVYIYLHIPGTQGIYGNPGNPGNLASYSIITKIWLVGSFRCAVGQLHLIYDKQVCSQSYPWHPYMVMLANQDDASQRNDDDALQVTRYDKMR